jgi:hypothetical protein
VYPAPVATCTTSSGSFQRLKCLKVGEDTFVTLCSAHYGSSSQLLIEPALDVRIVVTLMSSRLKKLQVPSMSKRGPNLRGRQYPCAGTLLTAPRSASMGDVRAGKQSHYNHLVTSQCHKQRGLDRYPALRAAPEPLKVPVNCCVRARSCG